MFEREDIGYIDLQKTGSTTIISILREMLWGARRRKKLHSDIPLGYDRNKVTFISVREPLALYVSLFTFGAAEKSGELYGTLMRDGYSGLYEPNIRGCERWIDFVTDPLRASTLDAFYGRYPVHDDIGFLSFRLLCMSVLNSRKSLKALVRGRNDIKHLLKRERVYSDYVRTESLASDLFALFKRHETRLKFKHPLISVENMIARVPQKNVSTKIEGVSSKTISSELRQRVIDREWLIYKEFGYADNPAGLPSDQNPRFKIEP